MVSDILGYKMPIEEPSEPQPSVAKGQPARPSRFAERSFPLARLVSPLRRKLDSAFSSSTLRTSPVTLPAWQHDKFAVSGSPFPVTSPSAESHVDLIGVQSPPAASVPQSLLQSVDTLARRGLLALSHADTYSDAACVLLDPASDRDQKLFQCLYGIGESLAFLSGAMGTISSQMVHLRRLAYLDLARLDATRKETLMQQPWSAQTLFNCHIPAVLKDQDADDSRKANQRVLDLGSRVGTGKPREFYASQAAKQGKAKQRSRSHKRPFSAPGGSGSAQGGQQAKAPKGGKPKGSSSKGKQA